MKAAIWAIVLVVFGLVISIWLASPTLRAASRMAEAASIAPQLVEQPVVTAAPTQPIDVVVVLDDSGSMATCWPWPQGSPPFEPPCRFPSENPPSDPEELRYSAARLLLQLADDDDRMAVVRFDTIAEGVGALGTLQRVGDGANRSQLAASLQPPTDYLPRGYTRIDLGLEQAINLLDAAREPGRNQYVLLLTDGEPTSPAGAGGQRERITAQLETLRNAGVLVFPVVLCNASAGCPAEFLREVFADGSVNEAGTAQDLLQVFSEILTRMKPDRSLIAGRNSAGALEFVTRAPHGVQSVVFVTPHGGLAGLSRDGSP
ncbi:MAG TPA: vWA domain-containing protein, partial [Caldilineaceae bacterium]|nr:vWA domain-containing protein [Caldilineaceae bacterium]